MVAGDRVIHCIRLAAVGGNVEGVLIRSGPAGDGHRHPLAGGILHPHAIGAISSLLFPRLIYTQYSIPSYLFQVIISLVNLLTFLQVNLSPLANFS